MPSSTQQVQPCSSQAGHRTASLSLQHAERKSGVRPLSCRRAAGELLQDALQNAEVPSCRLGRAEAATPHDWQREGFAWVLLQDAEGAARGPQLQPDQLAELRQLFAMYDLQHEGLIRRKHLEQAGLDGSEELSVLFRDAEAVTLDQFVSLLAPSYK